MGDAIGDLLPSAIGVAISPVPMIAVILMLGTPRARTNGPAFALGWIAGLVSVSTLVLLLSGGADDPDSVASDAVGWTRLVVGALFLLMAARQWKARPQPGVEPEMPKWMAAIDSFSPGRSLGFGVLLSGVNPKNLALAFAAGTAISQAGVSAGGDAVALAVFVAIGSLTVAGPVILYLATPRRAETWLAEGKDFMAAHSAVIMMVVLLVLGTKLLGDGLQILTA
jgi:threonine/homoserine/homoserine lactone efflux protein